MTISHPAAAKQTRKDRAVGFEVVFALEKSVKGTTEIAETKVTLVDACAADRGADTPKTQSARNISEELSITVNGGRGMAFES